MLDARRRQTELTALAKVTPVFLRKQESKVASGALDRLGSCSQEHGVVICKES